MTVILPCHHCLHQTRDDSGRLRRKKLSDLKAQGLQVGGGQVRGVLPYRCQAPATGQHPRHGQGQHRRQVMAYPAPVAGIGKVP